MPLQRQQQQQLLLLLNCTNAAATAITGAELDSVVALSFETLIPKNIVERYVSLLVEQRRLILCGPTGTGKTYLASRLARHLVRRSAIIILFPSTTNFTYLTDAFSPVTSLGLVSQTYTYIYIF